jgi:hypothetical protein
MPAKNEIVSEQLEQLRHDLRDLWVGLRTDPKEQARKARMWMLLSGALTAASTLAARQLATKLWTRLTGELPPPLLDAEKEAAKVRQEAGLRS